MAPVQSDYSLSIAFSFLVVAAPAIGQQPKVKARDFKQSEWTTAKNISYGVTAWNTAYQNTCKQFPLNTGNLIQDKENEIARETFWKASFIKARLKGVICEVVQTALVDKQGKAGLKLTLRQEAIDPPLGFVLSTFDGAGGKPVLDDKKIREKIARWYVVDGMLIEDVDQRILVLKDATIREFKLAEVIAPLSDRLIPLKDDLAALQSKIESIDASLRDVRALIESLLVPRNEKGGPKRTVEFGVDDEKGGPRRTVEFGVDFFNRIKKEGSKVAAIADLDWQIHKTTSKGCIFIRQKVTNDRETEVLRVQPGTNEWFAAISLYIKDNPDHKKIADFAQTIKEFNACTVPTEAAKFADFKDRVEVLTRINNLTPVDFDTLNWNTIEKKIAAAEKARVGAKAEVDSLFAICEKKSRLAKRIQQIVKIVYETIQAAIEAPREWDAFHIDGTLQFDAHLRRLDAWSNSLAKYSPALPLLWRRGSSP